jgi:heme-degrading monooxygenase HmoA
MIAVLIHWRIRPGGEQAFVRHWARRNVIRDRRGLMAEVLTRQLPAEADKYCWDLDDEESSHVSYYTVGLWHTLEDFEAQVGPFMSAAHAFEIAPRRRAVFDAIGWRKGLAPLPPDSADVI